MSVDLYERYKDALRRGHMAMARGQLEAALEAYREAMDIAPDRALPHAGVGQVLLRQGATPGALAAFDAVLARTPRDERGLQGRAEALARLGRRTDAAEALDVLAEAHESVGRIGDAADATRRALDLAEQKARRRHFQDLTRRLRLEASGPSGDNALAKALRPLAPGDRASAGLGATGIGATGIGGPGLRVDLSDADGAAPDLGPTVEPGSLADDTIRGQAAGSARDPGEPADERALTTAEVVPASIDVPPDASTFVTAAEAALDAGDLTSARVAYLSAAAAFDVDGLLNAALDACYVALAFAPDDVDVHLRLVELYMQLGWVGPAADKLALLGRLTELDGRKGRARARIVGLAADHFPDDPRLRRMSAQGALRP